MIAAESYNSRVGLAIDCDRKKFLASQRVYFMRGEGPAMQKFLVAVFDLLDGIFVVVWRDGNVAAIDDLEAGEEGVDSEGHVVAPVQSQTT